MKWRYTRGNPCQTCYGWDVDISSSCTHEKYVCPECGRKQRLLHWPYPTKTMEEAVHFLKSAELRTGKKCFVRRVKIGKSEKWEIFTSEDDYRSYRKQELTEDKRGSFVQRLTFDWKARKKCGSELCSFC